MMNNSADIKITNDGWQYENSLKSPLVLDPPKDMEQLLQRLNAIMGRSVNELAVLAGVYMPEQSRQSRGYSGQIIELFLGADASNQSLPDFVDLGIELKTIPVSSDFTARETTFISAATINPERYIPFERTSLYSKVRHMLFVILFAPKGLPPAERRILGYFFFQPDKDQLAIMEQDYNEFNELIFSGRAHEINGTMGNILQMRPKALDSLTYTPVRDTEGNTAWTTPRGYYFRQAFTTSLLQALSAAQGLQPGDLAHLKELQHILMPSEPS